MRRAITVIAMLVIALGAVLLGARSSHLVFQLQPGADVQAVLNGAPSGSTVGLLPGTYRGPLTVERALRLVGTDGTVIIGRSDEPVVTVIGEGAQLANFETRGGYSGIQIRETEDVTLDHILVRGAATHGIEIVSAHAVIRSADISGLTSPYAQGIEIRNAGGRPRSEILNSQIDGGQEGIASHVSRLIVERNEVTGTTMRAITITEMSDGWVRDNVVTGVEGAGLFCGDMSRCEFSGNRVSEVGAGYGGRSSAGWGLVVHYHASASSSGDELTGAAGRTATFVHSRITERSPLEPGMGSRATWPAALATLAALAALGLIYLIARVRLKNPIVSRGRLSLPVVQTLFVALAVGLAIQSFHMSEHFVQLWRVKVDGVTTRGGILGPIAEAELIHLIYNSAVVAFMGGLLLARRRGWTPPGNLLAGDRLLTAAFVLQSYHLVEHGFKFAQHLTTGRKVNPGIAGNGIDLVLFHFSINLAVYLGFLGASLVYVMSRKGKAASMEIQQAHTATT
jgi:hypothetical protein